MNGDMLTQAGQIGRSVYGGSGGKCRGEKGNIEFARHKVFIVQLQVHKVGFLMHESIINQLCL